MTDRYKIKTKSQALFLEAIASIPVKPKTGDLLFSVDGIFDSVNDGRKKYLKLCEENGVFPFSTLELKYNESKKIFRPSSNVSILASAGKAEDYDFGVSELVRGNKRFHEIKFELPYSFDCGFEVLKNKHIKELLNSGYILKRGDLALSMHHLTGYNYGDHGDTMLIFESIDENLKSLDLKIGSKISESDEKEVIAWFSDLKEKYAGQMFLPIK